MKSSNAYGALVRRTLGAAVVALTAAALLPAEAPAQSGEELLTEAMERYEERAAGIDNYTVVQEIMGTETRERFVKTEMNGHPIFLPEGTDTEEMEDVNPWAMFPRLVDRARVQGTETVNGVRTHVLVIEDLEGLGLSDAVPQSQGSGEFAPETMTMYLGADDYLIHRMRLTGSMQMGGNASEVTLVANMKDYRQVEGFYHPFLMEARLEGLTAALPPEQRQKLQQMQEQLESMPPQQREQMKKMLGPQLEALSSGQMEFTVTVKDLQVNTPSPDGGGSGS